MRRKWSSVRTGCPAAERPRGPQRQRRSARRFQISTGVEARSWWLPLWARKFGPHARTQPPAVRPSAGFTSAGPGPLACSSMTSAIRPFGCDCGGDRRSGYATDEQRRRRPSGRPQHRGRDRVPLDLPRRRCRSRPDRPWPVHRCRCRHCHRSAEVVDVADDGLVHVRPVRGTVEPNRHLLPSCAPEG